MDDQGKGSLKSAMNTFIDLFKGVDAFRCSGNRH
jgi:hypothetical protein